MELFPSKFGFHKFTLQYMKVLLHERKRHTARCVASTRCACRGVTHARRVPLLGGYPCWGTLCWKAVSPHQLHGVPLCLSGGYPCQEGTPAGGYQGGTPARGVTMLGDPLLEGCIPPSAAWGTPVQTWEGGTPPPSAGWGTPPPRCELTDKLKILPPSILQMRAVIIKRNNTHR